MTILDSKAKCGLITLMMITTVSCASPGKKTAVGAGAGAATGAAIGGAAGGWGGAAIGAAAGGLVGGSIGNYLDRQAQELEKVAETQRTTNGILVKLKNDLLFPTGSSVLKQEAIDGISQLGDILAKYDQDRIRVEGFTDNTGSQSKNEQLSKRRAQAVKDVLVSRGVKENQMLVLGQGENRPVASNSTKQGRSQNRRVELHIDVPQKS